MAGDELIQEKAVGVRCTLPQTRDWRVHWNATQSATFWSAVCRKTRFTGILRRFFWTPTERLFSSTAAFTALRASFPFFIALIPCLFGCAGYHLGPTNGYAAGDKSIQIMPFVNQTLEPRLTDAVTAQLRKQVQHDGTFRLATHDDGDIVVTGIITKYTRHELSFQPADTLTARDYRISLTAQVTARERISGKVVLDQEITGLTLLRVGPDIVSSERQGLDRKSVV